MTAQPSRFCATTTLALSLLLACSNVRVEDDLAPGTSDSSYTTFWQLPPPASVEQEMPGYDTTMGNHIQAAIAHELTAKGLELAPKEGADLIVAFSVDGRPRQDVEWMGDTANRYGEGIDDTDYVDGTLSIDLFDSGAGRLVWRAIGQTHLYGGSSRSSGTADDVVEEFLKDFPSLGADR
jgi:hypothetical protein